MRGVRSRASSRPSGAADRSRTLPARSALTLSRPPAAALRAQRQAGLGEALREGREALADIQSQLDALLIALRGPVGPDLDAPDRLRRATRRAGEALARLVPA